MPHYCIGIDFGTLSARALLVDARTGRELSSGVCDYPHGVMESALPSGEKLGFGWALQDPADYLFALEKSVALVLRDIPGCAGDVIGIGIDATACTLLPVTKNGTPLCSFPEYAGVPHAYAKLWQHNAPQRYADRMTELAARRGEPWLFRCGGRVDAQWAVPKLWQALEEAPDVYEAADAWIEAGDWLVWQLCGRKARSASTAGYKALHSKHGGYPSEDYFAALHPGLASVMRDKLSGDVLPVGGKAGELLADMAKRLGLTPGIAVAVSLIDAHACMTGCGITQPGTMLYIAGTSGCHLVLGEEERPVPGICGVVEDGMMPGFYGYEAGQSCVGDAYAWLTEHLVPEEYARAAREQGISLHSYLTGLAQKQKPGQSGLLALDFWRGNRSTLSDSDLSGLILGLTPASRAEDIYRAMLEATAFGTRVIIDNYREHGVRVDRFAATGGISRKNPLLMQILADVCGMPVEIAAATQSGALGSAIFAAAAAGSMHGGWNSAEEAASHMAPGCEMVYYPNSEHSAVYDRLYREYRHLYDYFGRGENDVMKRLSALKRDAQREREGAWHGMTDQDIRQKLSGVKCFLLDMDGTFYLGNKLLDGSLDFLDAVERTGRQVMFLTNNSSRSVRYYEEKLRRMNVREPFIRVMTSGQAACRYAMHEHSGRKAFLLGNKILKGELEEMGLLIDNEHPDYVLVAYDTELDYKKMDDACRFVRAGLPYIATHPDFNCPTEDGYSPDIGAIMAFIHASTGRMPDVVIGKPNAYIAKEAMRQSGMEAGELAMVGDRLYTDVETALRSGMCGILVMSGETDEAILAASERKPDLVFDRLADMIPYL